MCGIAAARSADPARIAPEVLESVSAALARRGPDGSGVFRDGDMALVHRRLSIVDLSERGAQPMSGEDGTVVLTCNGEIYNHRALRARLEAAGHRFRSESDSEVILHLHEEDPDGPERWLPSLEGMFAFVLLDRQRRRLVAARDRLGIKPLATYRDDGFVAFASDLDALRRFPGVPSEVDWTSVHDYLCLLTVPGPFTIFRGISMVEPGTVVVIDGDRERTVRWWDPPAGPPIPARDAAEALETVLGVAVRSHLVADVEVGAFLSGGLDSGVVVSMAAETSPGRLRTFAATFPGEDVDESLAARAAAHRAGVLHREHASTGDFLGGIEDAVAAMDQPLGLTSALSLHALSLAARRDLKVVLTGDGGDEILAGYDRHRSPAGVPRSLRWVPGAARPAVGAALAAAVPAALAARVRAARSVRAAGDALRGTEAGLYLRRLRVLPPSAALALLPRDARPAVDLRRHERRVAEVFAGCPFEDPLNRVLYADLRTSLVDEMMAKADRMTMATGLEARVPFLDRAVVELALRIPGPAKRRGDRGKIPLREIARRRLGGEAADRPKTGFRAPLDRWLREDAETRTRRDRFWPLVESCPLLDGAAVGGAWADYEARRSRPGVDSIMGLLVLALWTAGRKPTLP